jgi:hypothetical protein
MSVPSEGLGVGPVGIEPTTLGSKVPFGPLL